MIGFKDPKILSGLNSVVVNMNIRAVISDEDLEGIYVFCTTLSHTVHLDSLEDLLHYDEEDEDAFLC